MSTNSWISKQLPGLPRVYYRKQNPSQVVFDIGAERDVIFGTTAPIYGILVVVFLAFARHARSKSHIERIVSKLERQHIAEILKNKETASSSFMKRK